MPNKDKQIFRLVKWFWKIYFYQSLIIFSGGYDRGECLNLVELYDVETNTWSLLPPMKHNRGRFDITCVGGDVIYAVAGSNGQAEINSVEKFDANVGKWTKSASLPVNLSNIGNKLGAGKNARMVVRLYPYCMSACYFVSVFEPLLLRRILIRWLVNCLVVIIIRPVSLESRVGLGSNPETLL